MAMYARSDGADGKKAVAGRVLRWPALRGLKASIFLPSCVGLLVFGFVVAIVLIEHNFRHDALAKEQAAVAERLRNVSQLSNEVATVDAMLLAALDTSDAAASDEAIDSARSGVKRLLAIEQRVDNSPQSFVDAKSGDTLGGKLGAVVSAYREQAERAVESAEARGFVSNDQLMAANLGFRAVVDTLSEVTSATIGHYSAATEAIARNDAHTALELGIGLVFAVVLSLCAAFVTSHLLARDMRRLSGALTAVSEGRAWSEPAELDRPDEVGAMWRAIAAFKDTQRRLTEERDTRHESERELLNLFENSGDAIVMVRDDHYVAANRRAEELFECPRDEIIGQPISTFAVNYHSDVEATQRWFQRELAKTGGRVIGPIPWRNRTRNGREFPTEVTITFSRGEDGPAARLVMVRDVSARVEVERLRASMTKELEDRVRLQTQELQDEIAARREVEQLNDENRKWLDTTLAFAPSGILLLDEDLTVRVVNDWYREAYGIPADEPLVGRNYEEVMREILESRLAEAERDDADVLRKIDERISDFQSRTDRDLFDYLPDGRIFRINRRFVKGVGYAVIYVDVTQFTSVEEELERTRLLLAQTIDSAPVGIVVADEDSRVRFVNNWYRDIYGLNRDEDVVGVAHADLVRMTMNRRLTGSEGQDHEIYKEYARRLNEIESRIDADFDDYLPDGRIIKVMRRHSVGIGCVVSYVDMTDVRNAEAALQEQRQLLDATIENAPVGLVVLDEEDRIRLVNTRFMEAEGLTDRDALIGMKYVDLIRSLIPDRIAKNPEHAAEIEAKIEERIASLERREDISFETFGNRLKVERHYVPGVGFIIINVDISDLKRVESELRQTLSQLERTQQELVDREKMAALGNLVGGLAHEINTPVGVCVTAASHIAELVERLNSSIKAVNLNEAQGGEIPGLLDMMKDGLTIIERNLQRAAGLVGSFKQVAIDQTADDLRTIEINAYVDDVMHSLAAETRRAKLDIHFERSVQPVSCRTYPGAIAQILTNLVMNAIFHAYEEGAGGLLDIEIDDDKAETVAIIVRDRGKGMDEETKARIFEPFFTTERGRGGTGLGLHIAFNLVTQRLGGTIHCNSKKGEGTEFVLRLPRNVDPKDERGDVPGCSV